MNRCLLLVFALLLSVAPAHAAAPVEADLAVWGNAQFAGTAQVDALVEGIQHQAVEAGQGPDLWIGGQDLAYELWDIPYLRVAHGGDNPVGTNAYQLGLPPELIAAGVIGGSPVVQGHWQNGALVRVLSGMEPWPMQINSTGAMSIGRSIGPQEAPVQGDIARQMPEASHFMMGQASAWDFDIPLVEVEGALRFLAYGVNVTDGSRTFVTGKWVDQASAHDPQGWHHAALWHRYVLVATASQAVASFASPPSHQWTLHVSHAEGILDGDLEISQAAGQGTVNGTSISEQQRLFQAIGTFTLQADYSQHPAPWEIRGTATFAAVDGLGIFGDRLGHLDTAIIAAAIAGAGLLLVWKLALLASHARGEALAHPSRRKIAALLANEPGMALLPMAGKLGISRSSARHHVRRLQQAGLVSHHGKGKNASYSLNSHSSLFPVAGQKVRAADVFKVLQHPVRRLIFESCAKRPLDHQQFLAEAEGLEVPANTFSRHCTRLAELGLLERRQHGHGVRWSATLSLEDLQRHYKRAFLVQLNWWPIYEALETPQRHADLLASLPKRSEVGVECMVALGFVRVHDGIYQAEPL